MPLLPAILSIPVIGTMITWFIRFMVGTFIARLIFAFGISIVTYNVGSSLANTVRDHMMGMLNSLHGDFYNVIENLGFIQGINMLIAAYVAAFAIKAAKGGFTKIMFGSSSE